MSSIKEGSDINVGSIEKDIKRCEELIKTEHANWIGISNQLSIAHLIERIKELEAKLEFKNWGDLDNTQFEEYMNQFVSKQKVKDKIEEYDRKMTEDKGHPNWVVTDRIVMNVLEELLEDK